MTVHEWFQSHRVQPTVGDRYQALICPKHQTPLLCTGPNGQDTPHLHMEYGRGFGPCCFREAIGYAEETYRLDENRVSERLKRYFGS